MADEFKFIDSEQADVASLIRVRSLLSGFSGSGKTYTALKVATELAALLEPVYGRHPTIWLLDTERESALLYRGDFRFKHLPFPPPHSTKRYLSAIDVLRRNARPGDIYVHDSLSHAWQSVGGILERVDIEAKKTGGNKWAAWSILTPDQNKFVEALLGLPMHLFATTRARVEWVEGEERGKKTYKKQGTSSIQREGLEYEFTVELVFNEKNGKAVEVGKTRIKGLAGEVFDEPGADLARELFRFAMTGKGDATDAEVAAGIARFKAQGVSDKTIAESSPAPAAESDEDQARPAGMPAGRVSAAAMVAEREKAEAAAGKAAGAPANASSPAGAAAPSTGQQAPSSTSTSSGAQPAATAGSSQPASPTSSTSPSAGTPAAAGTQTAGTEPARATEPAAGVALSGSGSGPGIVASAAVTTYGKLLGRMGAAKTIEELHAVRPDIMKAWQERAISGDESLLLAQREADRERELAGQPPAAVDQAPAEKPPPAAAAVVEVKAEEKTEQQRLAEEPQGSAPQIQEHARLAKILVEIPVDDDEAFRKFPGLISEASRKKLLDQVGYDDLVSAYKATKKMREKKRAAAKKGAADAR